MDQKARYSSIFFKAADLDLSVTDKKLTIMLWQNTRSKSEGGLRLTDEGLLFVTEKANLKTYAIPIPKEIKITPQILVWLDQFINSPWHLIKNTITVISEKSAFELYLFSGDVRKLGQSKAMSKRLNSIKITDPD